MKIFDEDVTIAAPSDMRSVFPAECVVTIEPDTDKETAIRQLVCSLAQADRISWQGVSDITQALVQRELCGTTALGKGLAFPHMRTRDVDESLGAIGIAGEGIDFQSLDSAPTRLIILLLSPFEQRRQHAEIMGRLATLMQDKTLQYSAQVRRTPEAILHLLGF